MIDVDVSTIDKFDENYNNSIVGYKKYTRIHYKIMFKDNTLLET